MPGLPRSAMNRNGEIQIPSMNVKRRVRMMFRGKLRRACIAMNSGANIASMVMMGCCATACMSAGCVNPKATPSAVTMTLMKTRP
jgi:hypothetical protein